MLRLSRFDSRLLARELHESLAGAIARAVNTRGDRELAMEFRQPGRSATLLFRLDPQRPMVYESGKRIKVKQPQGGNRFIVETARALGGTRLEEIHQQGYERHLTFRFAAARKHEILVLHFLAFSPKPNLLLTTRDGRILTLSEPDGELRPGEIFAPVQTEQALPPEQADWVEAMAKRLADVDGARSLARLAGDAGLPKRLTRHLLPEHYGGYAAQHQELETVRQRLLHGPWQPVILDDEAGKPELHPFLLDAFRSLPHEFHDSVNAALETEAEEGAGGEGEALKQQVLLVLNRELKQERRKHGNIQGDREEAEGSEQDRLFGDLLLSYAHQVPPEAASAEVPDPENPAKCLVIPLDREKSATENAQEYYERYKRRKRKGEVAAQRARESAARIERLEALRDGVEQAEGEEALRQQAAEAAREAPALLDLLQGEGPPRRGRSEAKHKRRVEPQSPYPFARLFYSADGFRLLVGKDAKGNDELVRKAAHGNDLWFHIEGGTGSHVLIKRDGYKEDISQQALMDAALLAAHYSNYRGDTRTVVHWTEAKYVRKPKGLPPGKVLYSQHRTIMVGPDDNRLERLHRSVEEKRLREVME